MTDDELSDIGRAWVGDRVGTHWDGCHLESRHHGCAVARLMAEVLRLRAELAGQKAINLRLAERLKACSEVLGKAAERGRVCECEVTETRRAERVLVTPAGPDHNQPHEEGLTDG